MKSLFPKPLTSTPNMLLICIIDFLLYVPIVRYFHLKYCTVFTKWEWVTYAGVDRGGFGIKQDFILLFFSMYVNILWQGQKAVITIVEFEFVDIVNSHFQLSTFSICSKFCVENWLLCCDLSCKWVTYRSGCKRFWKQALQYERRKQIAYFKPTVYRSQ